MPSVQTRLRIVAAALGVALVMSIPVMAAYGLSVCPVLMPLGFWFGCQYLALFAANVIVLNALWLRRLARTFTGADGALPVLVEVLRAVPRRSFFAYLTAYGVTVVELWLILAWREAPLQSRGPEVLALVVLLLATLQYYGTAWAILAVPCSESAPPSLAASRRRWIRGALRVTVPSLIAAALGVHFLVRSSSLAQVVGATPAALADPTGLIPMIVFLLAWQAAAMGFYAAAEVDLGGRAARHLQAIAGQDYQHRSGLFGWGYWPDLFRAMNQLSQGLLERARLLKGFSAFVSNRVVDDVLKQELRFGGTREELTVLMTDLRDFTKLAETLPPEDVVRLLNLYFYAMIEELSREGVTVDKFIGDGLLAYVDTESGPAAAGDECARAVRAALAMAQRLGQVNEKLVQLGLPRLRLGIGVARGALVRGNIGSVERMQYTVIGDTVNLAARLESLCKDLAATIVLEQSVWAALPPVLQARFHDRGAHAVKGRTEKVRVYTA